MAEVFVELDGSGRLVVRKAATSPRDDPAAEAAWLQQAAGPGVAVLAAVDPAGRWLATAHAGAHTWRTARPAPAAAARLAAGLLRTAARLHQQGLVHGAISADHVVIGPDGPVLCSPAAGAVDPEVDRAAVVALLEDALERWHHDGDPVPASPTWSRALDLLRRPTSGWTLNGVADVLDPPVDGPIPTISRRASRGFRLGRVRRLRGAPTAGTPAGRRRSPRPARPPHRWPPTGPAGRARSVSLGLAAVAVVALAGAVVALTGAAVTDRPGPTGAAPATDDGLGVGPEPAAGPPNYRSDRPGDVTATAPAPCPGTPPAAVLDPATGTVWVYPSLPTPGRPVPGMAIQRTPGASDLDVRGDDGCDRIVVIGPAGEAAVPAG